MMNHDDAESLTSEQLDERLIAQLTEQLVHLSCQYSVDNGPAEAQALSRALDAWDEFIALHNT